MAKLFIGLAIIVMLAAAMLGFLSKGNIDKLQSALKETKQTLSQKERKLTQTEGELKKSQEDLTTANSKVEQQTTEIAGLKSDKDKAAMDLAEAKTALDAAAKKVADLEEAARGPKPAMPNAEDPRLATLQADLDKAKAELAEKSQMVESLNRSKQGNEEKLSEANKEIDRYRSGVTKQGLTGKVLAVNPGWNFVVLSVGDRQGAATGGMMIVTRGGEPIGRVRITSIEPSTSIGDIVPGSVRRGVSVQPGDAVIYEGPRNKPNPVTSPAPNAAGAASAPAPPP
ncbi:MAG TPA: hypothetical protein VEO95_12615 [Chthoniobacteraceae bacterium]|nr:hypothetical protein [Chthoniobacteraceae bacterium]